ncbi:MAG: NAD(P)-dependent oxidoreductase [Candidatus Margulisbacteria bacterium]|nr:NAD(P)-dependent oxidoreductase [Candidatus Margulisiibacteriota bacterium]
MEFNKVLVKNIFITGSTGCIGTYLVEQLINRSEYKLFLLIRDGNRLLPKIRESENVVIIKGDMSIIENAAEYLKESDYVINVATSWGGTKESNVQGVVKMLSLVNPKRLKKFIQFETASILGRGNVLLEEAQTEGTGYIKCKYDIYHLTKNHALADKIIRVYPTVVIGGAKDRPYSHISKGLLNLNNQIKLLRHFYIDFGFHFMHTEDIAKCVIYIMENVKNKHDLVLGNDYVTLKDFVKQVASYYGKKTFFRIKIPSWLISLMITIFRVKISAWDRFCFNYKWFKYETVNCEKYGIDTNKFTVEEIMQDVEDNR